MNKTIFKIFVMNLIIMLSLNVVMSKHRLLATNNIHKRNGKERVLFFKKLSKIFTTPVKVAASTLRPSRVKSVFSRRRKWNKIRNRTRKFPF